MLTSLRVIGFVLSMLVLASPAFAGRQGRVDLSVMTTPIYDVNGDAFIRHNGDRYSNRPLYCNHIYAAAFGGDKPYITLGTVHGAMANLIFGLSKNGHSKWFLNASDVTTIFKPGRIEWVVKDAAWGETTCHLELVPAAGGPGLVARVQVEGAKAGDRLVWASGGTFGPSDPKKQTSLLWGWDMTSLKVPFLKTGFTSDDCDQNRIKVLGSQWTVTSGIWDDCPQTLGRCSVNPGGLVGDARQWLDPDTLLASKGQDQPIACGSIPLSLTPITYWGLRSLSRGEQVEEVAAPSATLEQEFTEGLNRMKEIEDQVTLETPDKWLNAAIGTSCEAEDGCFREGIYSHSGMRWSCPLLGWRTLAGATVYGWHDNVKTDAKLAIANQITNDVGMTAKADPTKSLTSQAPDSRFFGKGRVNFHQPGHYDMQSQFFDQVQQAWRWTGDPELEKLLRPSLDLHCQYIQQCFDPANLGIYESYANTWPTDDQWYNGGGTSEETAYAYRAERTALQLAQQAGDEAGVALHTATLERIRKGFFDLLWIPERGHPGAYREQSGLKRLHESCWLYAIFCPIDAGLLTPEQAAQSLHFTEWGLERDKPPYGGEQCWPSNWVPSIWSVREMWSGDTYQLALAYFQTGLADDGWKLLRGTFPQQLVFGPVPGDMGHPAGGTDFNDVNSMFARSIVEGLFGYRPDYTVNLVTVAPQFPTEWDHASIKTPDVAISFLRSGSKKTYQITLTHAAPLSLELPVSAHAVKSVMVNGKPVKWTVSAGFGQSLVKLMLPQTTSAKVEVVSDVDLKVFPSVYLTGNTGDEIKLMAKDGRLIDFHDPQGVLKNGRIEQGILRANLTSNNGDHLVFGLAQVGDIQQWRLYKIHVTDVEADLALKAKDQVKIPASAQWHPVSLDSILNGDIRTIYQQKYLSPRPNTCSLRLATDGYSTWQMSGNGVSRAPQISLENLNTISDKNGNILAPQGVPFAWPKGAHNIAFTSTWDNWPKQIEIPVHQTGDAVWFLLCGTTNPMEVRIPNAELRMKYADGLVEKLQIIPPNNFWTMCPFDRVDYDYYRDGFALPVIAPTLVQLGANCRAVAVGWNLRPGVELESVTLETLSQEVVIGMMGLTVMKH